MAQHDQKSYVSARTLIHVKQCQGEREADASMHAGASNLAHAYPAWIAQRSEAKRARGDSI